MAAIRSVNRSAYRLAALTADVVHEGHQKRAVYYFAWQIIIGSLVKNVILFGIAAMAGALVPALITAAVFASLRMLAGGYHMDTYGKCLFVTLGMFLLSSLIARYTQMFWSPPLLYALAALTFIAGMYVAVRYAPKDTPHKPITEPEEIRRFKLLSVLYIAFLSALALVLSIFKLNMYAISVCFATLCELFTVTPTGHIFFDRLKEGMTVQKKRKKAAVD